MSTAIHTQAQDTFTVGARQYRWHEGDGALPARAAALSGRREALRSAFYATGIPGLERRGAVRQLRGVGPRGGAARAHWVTWMAPGDARPVWALFVPTGRVSAEALGSERPANDGALLAAWGDGPLMAWVSERPALQAAVREALRALPPWMADGVCSADAAFPLRVVRV